MIRENEYMKQMIHEGYIYYDDNFVDTYYEEEIYTGLSYSTADYKGETFIDVLYSYVDGAKHGICRKWDERGNLKEEKLFYNGCLDGYEREWGSKGQIILESITLYGCVIYRRKWSNSNPEKYSEYCYADYLKYYLEGHKKIQQQIHYSDEIELRFQDTYYMVELFKIIEKYCEVETKDYEVLLRQIIAFTHEWFERKDSLHKQFAKSIPAMYSQEITDAIVSNIEYDEDNDYYTFHSYIEYQEGEKNGLQLEWDNVDTCMHHMKATKIFKANQMILEHKA